MRLGNGGGGGGEKRVGAMEEGVRGKVVVGAGQREREKGYSSRGREEEGEAGQEKEMRR